MTVHERLRGVPPTPAAATSAKGRRWRRRQLVAAGFDEVTAERLASDDGIDLHVVLTLLDRGCAPGLAARIVTGTTLGDG